jgi:hypothetical protein
MALYDAPVHNGYKILTHTSTRRFAKNGFNQVGNTTLPTNPINPRAVMKSSIYNKNLSLKGISEAGYGRLYPNYGLSRGDPGGWGLVSGLRYQGAGSPRSSLKYAGAGSPRTSLAYAGAGSPRSSLKYAGAGSPRTSLRDAYINDNPPAGTLKRIGIPGRRNSIRGLADDPTVDTTSISPTTDFGVPLPTTSVWSDITGAFGSLFSTAVQTTTQAGSTAIEKAIQGGINPPVPTMTAVRPIVTVSPTKTTNILGMAIPTTALLLGGGVLAYFALKR